MSADAQPTGIGAADAPYRAWLGDLRARARFGPATASARPT
jgi:hypothetical protein